MWKQGRMLAACMLALAWWSIFYPELCFAEGTCEAVLTAETERTDGQAAVLLGRETDESGGSVSAQSTGADAASGILYADDDEIVISSRFLEWCEERLLDAKK